MNMNKISIPIFCLAALCAQPSLAQGTTPIDSIVAVVEEDVILRSELDTALATVLQQFQSANQALPSRTVLERQVLERLALVKLELQRADSGNINISDEEVNRSIAKVARNAGISVEQMRLTIESDNMSWAAFREDMRDELKTQQLKRLVVNNRINVTETEIDIFLASQNINRGEYRLAHILISIPEGASPSQVQAAREKVETVEQELNNGTIDFSTAAITYSDGQYALQGGDLGWRPADEVPTIFAEHIGDMGPDDISPPLRSASGFHLIKVVDYKATSKKMVLEFNALHIMIEVTELVGSSEALDIISDLHRRLLDGEDFGELAKQYSDDSSSSNLGGDMGWFQPAAFGSRVQQTLDQLDEGGISQPFQSNVGWHIWKKTGSREQDRTEEILRAQARESLRRRKAESELQLWERQLRDESYIEYRIAS
jgi:peptidyl-prolyl cis-trans isomerase SurA